MRAWGCGLRSSFAYSIRGRNRSSANFVAPVTLAVASTLQSALPTTRSSALPIQRLRRRLGPLAAHASGRQFDRLVDLDVTGAAAQVARQRVPDVVPGGAGGFGEQGLGGEQERGGAIAALRRAQLGESVLQRVQLAAGGHPLDRPHAPSRAGEAEHETGEHGRAVDQHGARAALTQLAAVLRAREAQVLAQHLEQGLVRREGHLDGLAVHVERDLRLGVGGAHVRNVILITAWWRASFRASQARRVSMRVACTMLGFALLVSPGRGVSAQGFRAQALRILKTVPLIDGHNDIPDAIRARGGLDSVDFAVLQPKLMTDIPKLRAGGVGGQFWAAYVPVTTLDSGPHPAVYALEQIDLIKR